MTTTKPVVILGPTASGKSDTAMAVARTTNTEIVVCDAMQVY
ncbi:MAG: tRNA (adenosine(37)-N6)-dimethylallyltransferase MiaA, partial [Actinobacteria bacterium]|nr:tRNA (adenosine(37)-N6)-dimethylallyltransferase MiaA [Actinomycetota bacterium]